ncbi:MAG: hypothetical protein M1537_01970 [Nitrospirae bacterium]|nr:hypothetical protein [Nitrospirota bacterium]MCL5284236.1 hypothetical protein [Nitrospirota bacterium]
MLGNWSKDRPLKVDPEKHPNIQVKIEMREICITRTEVKRGILGEQFRYCLTFQRRLTPEFLSLAELDAWLIKNGPSIRQNIETLQNVEARDPDVAGPEDGQ